MGLGQVRYRGLAKNANRSFVKLSLANLYLARARLTEYVRPSGYKVCCKAHHPACISPNHPFDPENSKPRPEIHQTSIDQCCPKVPT